MGRKLIARETRTCQQCGAKFTVTETSARKFCSPACGYAGRDVNRAEIKGREPYEVSYRQAIGVVQLMIDDAKDEMVRIRDKGKTAENSELLRFDSCQRWLMNLNGGLENLLMGCPGIHVEAALSELSKFASVGWKTAKRKGYSGSRVRSGAEK